MGLAYSRSKAPIGWLRFPILQIKKLSYLGLCVQFSQQIYSIFLDNPIIEKYLSPHFSHGGQLPPISPALKAHGKSFLCLPLPPALEAIGNKFSSQTFPSLSASVSASIKAGVGVRGCNGRKQTVDCARVRGYSTIVQGVIIEGDSRMLGEPQIFIFHL